MFRSQDSSIGSKPRADRGTLWHVKLLSRTGLCSRTNSDRPPPHDPFGKPRESILSSANARLRTHYAGEVLGKTPWSISEAETAERNQRLLRKTCQKTFQVEGPAFCCYQQAGIDHCSHGEGATVG